jgi:hypothetical protein
MVTADDYQKIQARWAAALPVPPAIRNRMLAQRMKLLTSEDPWAYDIAKQDAKEYM